MSYISLKSGTDIRGIAIGADLTLDGNAVKTIANAFAIWVSKNNKNENIKIGVGCDSRITNDNLKENALKGICNAKFFAYDCGIASTPAMFMGCIFEKTDFDGSIELTASHLPYEYNGMKFFTKKGGIQKNELDEIIKIADEIKINDLKLEYKKVDLMKLYSSHIKNELIKGINLGDKPFNGLKIIVDAGNGVGGFFANDILKPLGADIDGSQFLKPDGMFPNHIPNPENKEAMEYIKKAVIESKADFGVIFDTDCDRAAVVDYDGKEINRNKLIALISAIVLKEYPNTYIVTDSVTSTGLKIFIESIGGKQHRFKRGYKNVINESLKLNEEGKESYLAIETSGHAAMKENYFLDDGAYLVSKILIELVIQKSKGNKIGDLIKDLKEPLESYEKRYKILVKDFKSYGDDVIEYVKNNISSINGYYLEMENYEGVRVNYKINDNEGWFLLRKSLHEPVMPLNIESNFIGGNKEIYKTIDKMLNKFKELR